MFRFSTLLLVLLLSVACHAEKEHYYFFGDSLSSPTGCEWPKYIDGAIHNYAQAALALRDFDFPSHFHPRPRSKVVVYFGSNDAFRGYPVEEYGMQLQALTYRLLSYGVKVYLVGQPYLDVFVDELAEYRLKTEQVAKDTGVTYLQPVWGTESTGPDGVHLTCWNHFYFSGWMQKQLGEK